MYRVERQMHCANARNFKVRLFANYIDTDFRCCESIVTV